MNRRTTLFAVVVCCCMLLLAACGTQSSSPPPAPPAPPAPSPTPTPPPPSTTPSADTPESIVQQTCSRCHGDNLEGSFGPSLQHIGSVLTKDQILSIIQHGKGGIMPAQTQLSSADQEMMAEWLSKKK